MNEISANIKTLRREKGLSQEQFAQALHVTRQTVSAWERGLSRPGLDTLEAIARVLEVEPEDLLYGRGGKTPVCYRYVSYWPVLGAAPLFCAMTLWVIPIYMSLIAGTFTDDAGLILCGQIFLSMLVMFAYCSLKDEIRNREYYAKYPPEEREKPGDGE